MRTAAATTAQQSMQVGGHSDVWFCDFVRVSGLEDQDIYISASQDHDGSSTFVTWAAAALLAGAASAAAAGPAAWCEPDDGAQARASQSMTRHPPVLVSLFSRLLHAYHT